MFNTTKKRGSVTEYAVEFVPDGELPAPHDWMLIRQPGRKLLLVNEDHICPELIRDLWMGLHEVNGTD